MQTRFFIFQNFSSVEIHHFGARIKPPRLSEWGIRLQKLSSRLLPPNSLLFQGLKTRDSWCWLGVRGLGSCDLAQETELRVELRMGILVRLWLVRPGLAFINRCDRPPEQEKPPRLSEWGMALICGRVRTYSGMT